MDGDFERDRPSRLSNVTDLVGDRGLGRALTGDKGLAGDVTMGSAVTVEVTICLLDDDEEPVLSWRRARLSIFDGIVGSRGFQNIVNGNVDASSD